MADMGALDRIDNGVSALDGVLALVASIQSAPEIKACELYSLLRLIRDEVQAGLDGLQS